MARKSDPGIRPIFHEQLTADVAVAVVLFGKEKDCADLEYAMVLGAVAGFVRRASERISAVPPWEDFRLPAALDAGPGGGGSVHAGTDNGNAAD